MSKKNDVWSVETERFDFDEATFDAASCAELADELDLYRVQALADDGFEQSIYDWDCYVVENSLWLPLEQSCQGVTRENQPADPARPSYATKPQQTATCWPGRLVPRAAFRQVAYRLPTSPQRKKAHY